MAVRFHRPLDAGSGKALTVGRRPYTDMLMACWFAMPRAIEADGRTWTAGVNGALVARADIGNPFASVLVPVNPGGEVIVLETGIERRWTVDESFSDDHNNPSFLMETDRPPVIFSTRHNGDAAVRVRKGTTPLDLDTLGPVVDVPFTGRVSYAHTWRRPNTDRVILLTRSTAGDSSVHPHRWWCARVSDDYCDTWGAERFLIRWDDQGYLQSVLSGDTVHIQASVHPTRTTQQSIWYLAIDLDSGDITHRDGTVIGNVLAGTDLPLYSPDLDLVEPIADDTDRTWPEAIAADSGHVWSQYHPDDMDGGMYRYAHWDGEAWVVEDVVPTGGRFTDDIDPIYGEHSKQPYQGGASFDVDGDLWLGRRRVDTDGWWAIERWERDDGEWSLAETVAQHPTLRLVRPYCPWNRAVGPRVTWNTVSTYTGFGQYIARADWEGLHSWPGLT